MVDAASPVNRRIAECAPGEICISVISLAEIALGSQLGKPPLPETLEAFIEAIPLLPFDEAAAREYARLPFKRARFDRLLAARSEEHTSELQSLMRISYAVFCLKKKTTRARSHRHNMP